MRCRSSSGPSLPSGDLGFSASVGSRARSCSNDSSRGISLASSARALPASRLQTCQLSDVPGVVRPTPVATSNAASPIASGPIQATVNQIAGYASYSAVNGGGSLPSRPVRTHIGSADHVPSPPPVAATVLGTSYVTRGSDAQGTMNRSHPGLGGVDSLSPSDANSHSIPDDAELGAGVLAGRTFASLEGCGTLPFRPAQSPRQSASSTSTDVTVLGSVNVGHPPHPVSGSLASQRAYTSSPSSLQPGAPQLTAPQLGGRQEYARLPPDRVRQKAVVADDLESERKEVEELLHVLTGGP